MENLSDFDKTMIESLKELYDMAKLSGDILSETRMLRALYAFNLPPDEFCIIRKARKEDVIIDKSRLN